MKTVLYTEILRTEVVRVYDQKKYEEPSWQTLREAVMNTAGWLGVNLLLLLTRY